MSQARMTRLEPELARKLERLASQRDTTPSRLLRRALIQYLMNEVER